MFRKVLVANRGEIAIRAFRAAYELGIATVAVFPYEDRNSLHRAKADESYQIGEPGHPVRAYLSVDEVIKAARRAGADAVYPGYGFLSENPDLAQACADAGITFVGPPAGVLHLTGNKARAIAAAREAGVAVLRSSEPGADVDALAAAADDIGFPIFVKAVAGGGGRGMRRVERAADLRDAIDAAMREAESAFGDATVFLEQAVVNPRHIEVQILADAVGNVVHLYERDCSMQRRHQKVIEIAPAPNLDPELRDRICADAVAFAKAIGYVNAGTVEFLLDERGHHVFIEMNPRIQVEHTVTEQVTDRDLVIAQLRIASGMTLPELRLSQDEVTLSGAALQCRVTTEDPANGFRPDTGVISTYRSPGGPGVRLDGGTTHTGAEVSAHFDSMLVKLTCYGHRLRAAPYAGPAGRSRSSASVASRPTCRSWPPCSTTPTSRRAASPPRFIDERPELLRGPQVRRPRHPAAHLPRRDDGQQAQRAASAGRRAGRQAAPRRPRRASAPTARASCCAQLGPEGFAAEPARAERGGRHRHDVPRRPPVAARDPRAHPRPARRRPARRAHRPTAAVAGVLGRRDLRRRAAVPRRGPVGAARPRCARRRPTSARRCCCAAATPSATRRTRRR